MMLPLYEERRKIIADVKHFWLTVFRNHMGLSQIIEEEDVPVRAIFEPIHTFLQLLIQWI